MNVVLLEPEIPPNTGNVARLCAATGSQLHLISPLGFRIDDRELKRAAMDYWQHVDWRVWDGWGGFMTELPEESRCWFIEQGGGKRYDEVNFGAEDYLVFGRETAGLPRVLLERNTETWLRIPMYNPQARSLNLANCVSLVLYESLRQHGFVGELGD